MGSKADGHSFPSPVASGRKAKEIINAARENIAKMIGGRPQDMIFTSGGTESNNLVIHSVVKHFHKIHAAVGDTAEHPSPVEGALPHIITCTVEHDSIRLPLEHLVQEQVAEVTFVPVSKVNGQAEAEDILAAVRPATCLVTIMLANNETGVIMAAELVAENCEAYEAHMRDVCSYLEERLAAEFGKRIHLNSQFPGTERLPNTCNFSILGPQLQGRLVLAQCRTLLASMGAACHSDHGDRPSPVLLSCGIPLDVARNAIRLSVGRGTTRAEVDLVVQDLKQAVARLEGQA
eukprot:bmy_21794T0